MRRFVLLEEGGTGWAVPEEAIRGLEVLGTGVLVRLRSGVELRAGRILGREEGGERPLGPVLARFLPRGVGALAVVGTAPFAVVDPGHPPECLVEDREGGREKGGGR